MAEKNPKPAWPYGADLTVTKFNQETREGIYLLDLDHEGANLETPFPLSPEYHIEFSFVPPGATMEIQVSGRVMWWKHQLTVPPGRYQLRVQFYVPRWDLDRLLCAN